MNSKRIRYNSNHSQTMRRRRGVLTFEWIVLVSVICAGIVVGLAIVRDSITTETGDVAEAIMCVNQEYTYSPLSVDVSKRFQGVRLVWKEQTQTSPEGWEEVHYDYTTDWLSKTTGSKMIDTSSASGNQHVYLDTIDSADETGE